MFLNIFQWILDFPGGRSKIKEFVSGKPLVPYDAHGPVTVLLWDQGVPCSLLPLFPWTGDSRAHWSLSLRSFRLESPLFLTCRVHGCPYVCMNIFANFQGPSVGKSPFPFRTPGGAPGWASLYIWQLLFCFDYRNIRRSSCTQLFSKIVRPQKSGKYTRNGLWDHVR